MRSYQPKTKKQRQIIKDWIARLRNPNSRQTKERLKADKGNGYCCLGHLCKAMGLKFQREETFLFGAEYLHFTVLGEEKLLPASVVNELGLESDDPNVIVNGEYYDLSTLNDEYNLTLKEIADVVEADWIKGKPLKTHKKLKNI